MDMQIGSASRRGFTLIELMLVLVILAVLAAVVVPRFATRSQQARETAAKADIASIELALDAFDVDTGRYPTSDEGLDALMRAPTNVQNWRGPYLKRTVSGDPWGKAYNYRCPGTHNPDSYDLYSYGPDTQDGGGDDIDNWSAR
jgi:general secretion pathway protein G